jgi:hypothetical protein
LDLTSGFSFIKDAAIFSSSLWIYFFSEIVRAAWTKSNRALLWTAILCTFVGGEVVAGSWSSGGANAVVCRTSEGDIRSAELLDLYVWRELEHVQAKSDTRPFGIQAIEISEAIARGSWSGPIGQGRKEGVLIEETRRLLSILNLVGPGLLGSADSNHFVVPPRGCEIVPLARYQIASDRLYVNREIWQNLDETNRAALMVHEALYVTLRYSGERNSDRV